MMIIGYANHCIVMQCLDQQALANLKEGGLDVLGIIPRSVRVQEASGAQEILTDYDPKGKPTAAYLEAAKRVKKWLKQ